MEAEPPLPAASGLGAYDYDCGYDSDADVVSPPPLDALWDAEFEESLDRADGGQDFSDADALAAAERVDASYSSPPSPAAQHEPTTSDEKQARQVAQAARRRRLYRIKKKSELEGLRASSVALTERLAALVARDQALKDLLDDSAGGGRLTSGWHGVALRQLLRRFEAEAVNRELRWLTRRSHDAAQGLVATLQSQLSSIQRRSAAIANPLGPQTPLEAVEVADGDVETIATLLEEVNATYANAEAVLRGCQMPVETDQAYNWRQGWRRDAGADSDFFEHVETWVIPFRLEDAVPALHKSLPIVLGKECRPVVFPIPDPPSSATALKFFFSCTDSNRQTLRLQSLMVAKVFLRKDHAIFRWRSVTSERDRGSSACDAIAESGWGVARRAPSAEGGSRNPPGTRIEFYTRFCARGRRRGEALERHVDAALSDNQEDSIAEWYQVIESLVMNDMAALSLGQER